MCGALRLGEFALGLPAIWPFVRVHGANGWRNCLKGTRHDGGLAGARWDHIRDGGVDGNRGRRLVTGSQFRVQMCLALWDLCVGITMRKCVCS